MGKSVFELATQMAIKEALRSPIKHRYGAVLICNNKIVSSGYNKFRLPMITGKKYCLLRGHYGI
jgi:deoxycytidylate deaminase